MTLRERLNLIDGELAWRCEVVRVDGGRVVALESAVAFVEDVRTVASRLYLEVQAVDETAALIHRGGWPFDLKTFRGDPVGAEAASLRPRGAGDEVMRELIESFEAQHSGRSLLVRDADCGP